MRKKKNLIDFVQYKGVNPAYLVGHHHTLDNIEGMDYQILIEADYIVNADESSYSKDNIKNVMEKVFKTKTGIALLKSIYNL